MNVQTDRFNLDIVATLLRAPFSYQDNKTNTNFTIKNMNDSKKVNFLEIY